MKIAFVGGGNMAAALIAGLAGKVTPGANIHVVDPSPAALEALHGRHGVTTAASIDAAVTEAETTYPVSPRNQVKRLHERGRYDHATIHGLLDASMLCHVSYVIDGQPYCTPTFFWREGSKLYWHGSSASRMLRNQSAGQRVCLTVAQIDSLVLARCGFNHSADYRAVMAFGTAHLVTDPVELALVCTDGLGKAHPGPTWWARAAADLTVTAHDPVDELRITLLPAAIRLVL